MEIAAETISQFPVNSRAHNKRGLKRHCSRNGTSRGQVNYCCTYAASLVYFQDRVSNGMFRCASGISIARTIYPLARAEL